MHINRRNEGEPGQKDKRGAFELVQCSDTSDKTIVWVVSSGIFSQCTALNTNNVSLCSSAQKGFPPS